MLTPSLSTGMARSGHGFQVLTALEEGTPLSTGWRRFLLIMCGLSGHHLPALSRRPTTPWSCTGMAKHGTLYPMQVSERATFWASLQLPPYRRTISGSSVSPVAPTSSTGTVRRGRLYQRRKMHTAIISPASYLAWRQRRPTIFGLSGGRATCQLIRASRKKTARSSCGIPTCRALHPTQRAHRRARPKLTSCVRDRPRAVLFRLARALRCRLARKRAWRVQVRATVHAYAQAVHKLAAQPCRHRAEQHRCEREHQCKCSRHIVGLVQA